MKLRQLIKNIPHLEVKGFRDVEITGIASHSRCVAPGFLFVAKRGASFDGNRFIPEAISSGALVVLSDVFDPSIKQITQLVTEDVSKAEGALAAFFWGNPSRELHMVGITGTSGKTTTSYLVRQLFAYFGTTSGLIGTISNIAGEREYEALHTTPDVIATQRFLREVIKEGCQACVMEVSSHALSQGRVDHIDFDTAIFTNLTHEHLDYHKTMDEYAQAKAMLFSSLGSKEALAVYNAEDPYARTIVGTPRARSCSFAIEAQADVVARDLQLFADHSTFTLEYERKTIPVSLPLIGRFNVLNALAAATPFLARGYSPEEVSHALGKVVPPPGRLERIENSMGFTIYVDYAHKVDALKNVLSTIRESAPKKIIVVFGCGGDRDREKRPKMASVAETYADSVIVTSDNPRSENPDAIIKEICAGFSKQRSFVIPDRRLAIEKALSLATEGDIVLIAGKGHEKNQIFAHETVHFDDCEVARAYSQKREQP